MPTRAASFAPVREVGRSLPGVVTGTVYGSPALKTRGRMFACLAIHASAEPDTLAIRLPFSTRDALIAQDPATYYLTSHYVDYPCVLVRLKRVSRPVLGDLLEAGRRFVADRSQRVTPRRPRLTGVRKR